MELGNLVVGPEIYGEVLQGCVYGRALFTGQQLHARIIKNGDHFAQNEYLQTKLVIFYANCDFLDIAVCVFDRLRVKNIFSWAAIIGLHARMGFYEEALMGAFEMISEGTMPDNFVLPNVLKTCGALRWINGGRGFHGYAVKTGLVGCVYVTSSLVDLYGKCGVLEDARKLFDRMPEKNVISWNSMIVGNVQNGFFDEAIKIFFDMRLGDVEPSRVTLAAFLSASANLGATEEGKQGHAIAVLFGLVLDNILGSSILNFYCKVGSIENAELIFDKIVEKDAVTWNLLISSYVQMKQAEKALNLCHLMRLQNVRFDSVTLASVLSACADLRNMRLGKVAHCYCIRNNLESDSIVKSMTIRMYAKCERMSNARTVLNSTGNEDLNAWNTLLLTACAELGLVGETLKHYSTRCS